MNTQHFLTLFLACWLAKAIVIALPCLGQEPHQHLHGQSFAGIEPTGPQDQPLVLSSRSKQAIGVRVALATKQQLPLEITTVGKIEAIPMRQYLQHAPLSGRIFEVMVKLGDSVQAGQTLAIINSPEINQLAAETLQTKGQLEADIAYSEAELDGQVKQAQTQVDLWRAAYSRDRQLFEERIASQRALQTSLAELKTAEVRLETARKKKSVTVAALRAKLKVSTQSLKHRLQQLGVSQDQVESMLSTQTPILKVPLASARSGIVTALNATPGQSIEPAVMLFKISDLKTVWATASIYESDMARVRLGQKVTVKVAALPDSTFYGKLTFVSPDVDPQSRTLPVRVEIANDNLALKPGMFAQLLIRAAEPMRAVLLPKDAVVERGGHQIVYVETGAGFQPTIVETGNSFGDSVEIHSGINPGQAVVVAGAFQLEAQRLKASGNTELFTHPTEESHGEHHEHEKSESTERSFSLQTLLLTAIAFILGVITAVIAVNLVRSQPRGGSPPASHLEDRAAKVKKQ